MLLSASIDSAYKDIYNDYTDYVQTQIPFASMYLPDEKSVFDGKPVGRLDNKIADWIMTYSPVKFYAETDNTPVGRVQEWLRSINYEGLTRLKKDSTGKIEWTNDERQALNGLIGAQQPWKKIERLMKAPKYKYIVGKIRALRASGQELDWDRVEFKSDLLELYNEIE